MEREHTVTYRATQPFTAIRTVAFPCSDAVPLEVDPVASGSQVEADGPTSPTPGTGGGTRRRDRRDRRRTDRVHRPTDRVRRPGSLGDLLGLRLDPPEVTGRVSSTTR